MAIPHPNAVRRVYSFVKCFGCRVSSRARGKFRRARLSFEACEPWHATNCLFLGNFFGDPALLSGSAQPEISERIDTTNSRIEATSDAGHQEEEALSIVGRQTLPQLLSSEMSVRIEENLGSRRSQALAAVENMVDSIPTPIVGNQLFLSFAGQDGSLFAKDVPQSRSPMRRSLRSNPSVIGVGATPATFASLSNSPNASASAMAAPTVPSARNVFQEPATQSPEKSDDDSHFETESGQPPSSPLDVFSIVSLEWQPTPNTGILDNNPNIGGGKRIFPDRPTWWQFGEYNQIDLKVTVSTPGLKFSWALVDVDDPSSNEVPVDDETLATDNRDDFYGAESSGETDLNGIGWVHVYVGYNAGDNYKVVVGFDNILVHNSTAIQNSVQSGVRDGNGNIIDNLSGEIKVSPMLTVWRYLHVERDHMAAPILPQDGPFLGAGVPGVGSGMPPGGDDVAPNGAVHDPDISLMQSGYLPAYILVLDDLAIDDSEYNGNPNTTIPFVHNLPLENSFGNASRNLSSDFDFWVVQIVGVYEAGDSGFGNKDADHNVFSWQVGLALDGTIPGGPVYIFTETIRDVRANTFALEWDDAPPMTISATEFEKRTVFHESVHKFGYDHPINGPDLEGVMSLWKNCYGTTEMNRLTPLLLDIVRDRVNLV